MWVVNVVSEIIMADSVELKSLNETNNSETPVMGKQSTLQPKNLPRDRILDEQESNRSKRAKIQSWMIKNLSDQSVEGGGGAEGLIKRDQASAHLPSWISLALMASI